MKAFEVLKEIDSCKIVEKMTSFPNYFEMIDLDNTINLEEKNRRKEIIKQRLIKELDKIKSKDIKNASPNEILIVHERIDDCEYIDLSILRLSDFKDGKYHKEEFLKYNNPYINPLYSPVFMNREELLCMEVSKASLDKYGMLEVASSIANELTTFAIDEEQRDEIINNHLNDLEESIKDIKDKKTYTIEEVFEHLGYKDTRTKEEKELERKKYQERLEKGIKIQNELIIKTLDLYL